MNNKIFFGFIFIVIISTLNILFIPQFELPDGTHHLVKVILIEENRLVIDSLTKILRNIYFILYQPFHEISLFFPVNDICATMRLDNLMHCSEGTIYNEEFVHNNNSFSIFGLDINIYRYFNLSLSQHQISLLIFNFFLYFVLIFTYSKTFIKNNFPILIIIYLLFPSTITYNSYISPNILSILFNIVFFYCVISRKFYLYFFLSILFVYIDYQNITHLIMSSGILTYLYISKYLKLNIIQIIIILISFLIIAFLLEDFIFDIIVNFTTVGYSDISYLNEERSIFNFIKSFISFFLSLYYIGGSMQYLASFFEYLVFLICALFFLIAKLKRIKLSKINLNEDSHLTFYFFILSLFSYFLISYLFPTISQGRYYMFILLPVFYFYLNEFKIFEFIRYETMIIILFTINLSHLFKIYLSI